MPFSRTVLQRSCPEAGTAVVDVSTAVVSCWVEPARFCLLILYRCRRTEGWQLLPPELKGRADVFRTSGTHIFMLGQKVRQLYALNRKRQPFHGYIRLFAGNLVGLRSFL